MSKVFCVVKSVDGIMKAMLEELKTKINQVITELYNAQTEIIFADVPADVEGDYATNVALRLAKQVGKAPREVAEEIIAAVETPCELSVAGPGFINVKVAARALYEELSADWSDYYGNNETGAGKVAISEFPSTNIAKPYSVGHLRPGTQGWAAKMVLEANGWKVITDNHLGDAGTPFGVWAAGFKRSGKSLDDITIYDLGDIYIETKAALKAEASAGQDDLAEEVQDWLLKLEAGEAEATQLSERFKEISLDHMHEVMKRMDLSTDYELGESQFVEQGKEIVRKQLAAGAFKQNADGSVICELDGFDVPMLMQKSNGAALYATTDLGCMEYRAEHFHPDKVIYCTGSEQKFYFEQLFAVGKKLGIPQENMHLWFGMIDQIGPDGKREKMSSRKGVVLMEALLDDAEARVRANFASDELSDEDVRRIAVGAVKFSDFVADRKMGILYDPDKIFALTGCSGPFCQYACVRMRRVLEKNVDFARVDYAAYDWEAEKPLLQVLLKFPALVELVGKNLEFHRIAGYCFELAQELNRYYEKTPISTADDMARSARLEMTRRAVQVLSRGLELLGILIPEKM